jgi:ferric-dicitrate binding protein FerR (iron transport regulator)
MRTAANVGAPDAGIAPARLLLAAVPAVAVVVMGIAFAYGWLDLHGTEHHALGSGSSVEYRDDVRIGFGPSRHLDDGTNQTEVYLMAGSAMFVVAGNRHRRGDDAVTILTPTRRIEASRTEGTSFTVTADAYNTTVTCALCRHDVRVYQREAIRTL